LTASLVVRVLLMSAILVGGAMWLFHWERSSGATIAEARTSALNLFVATEAFYLFACRSLTRGLWQVRLISNR
jgi:cation-transporting ATPase F